MNYDKSNSQPRKNPVSRRDTLEDVLKSRRKYYDNNIRAREEIINLSPEEEFKNSSEKKENSFKDHENFSEQDSFYQSQKSQNHTYVNNFNENSESHAKMHANIKQSEIMIQRYDTMENTIGEIKNHLGNFKDVLDDLSFKLDSATSVIGVLKNNEIRKMESAKAGPSRSQSNNKGRQNTSTTSDLFDLLKNPGIQSLIRTILSSAAIGGNKKNGEDDLERDQPEKYEEDEKKEES